MRKILDLYDSYPSVHNALALCTALKVWTEEPEGFCIIQDLTGDATGVLSQISEVLLNLQRYASVKPDSEIIPQAYIDALQKILDVMQIRNLILLSR